MKFIFLFYAFLAISCASTESRTTADEVKPAEVLTLKSIQIIGNKALNSTQALARISLKPGMTTIAAFKENFALDLQLIKYNYLNRGFVRVKVTPPDLTSLLAGNRESVDLIFQVDEGAQYQVGDVSFVGDFVIPEKDLIEMTKIRKEKYLSYEVLHEDLEAINRKLIDAGYPRADIIPKTTVNEEQKTVKIVFSINKDQ